MRLFGCVSAALLLLVAGCGSSPARPGPTATPSTPPTVPASAVPHFAHVVVVVEENHADSQIIGDPQAPYLNELAKSGATLTDSFGVTHPSQPNYLALFSGSTQGVTDDSCPHRFDADNLGHQLITRGLSFVGYAESLPSVGYGGCTSGAYARKHAPWTDFADLTHTVSEPFTAFPADFARLPSVAFVIPNLDHDMHNGTVGEADSWLRDHLGSYANWARTHDSLLVVTWDEDDGTAVNRIPGVLAGAHVRPGPYSGRVDHYAMLRTIETAAGLPALGRAAQRPPITGVWTP